MEVRKTDVVVLEVPSWFHRRRGAREALRKKVAELLAAGRIKLVVSITDPRRFVSMDVGVLLGVIGMVRDAGGMLAVATANDKFHALPHPSAGEGLLRFRTVEDARRHVEEHWADGHPLLGDRSRAGQSE
jgi:hypothetical protein